MIYSKAEKQSKIYTRQICHAWVC